MHFLFGCSPYPVYGPIIAAARKNAGNGRDHDGADDGRDALENPEHYLWVVRPDGAMTTLDRERLVSLLNGTKPRDATERVLVSNPEWLRHYVEDILGDCVATIPEGGPLPAWSI